MFFFIKVQNLLERSNRERAAINDIQQKLINIYGNLNIPFPIQDNNMLNYQELYDNEQLLISENKLLEVFYFIFKIS